MTILLLNNSIKKLYKSHVNRKVHESILVVADIRMNLSSKESFELFVLNHPVKK